MARMKLTVTEQPPVPAGSIFCSIKLEDKYGNTTNYGHMYFVCDSNRVIIQYSSWLKGYARTLKKLGYSF